LITFPVGSTRWKFIDELGTLYGPFTLSYSITLEQTPGICEGHTYQVYCEVFATDAECGGIWWGYSAPRSIETCPSVCPSITLSSGTCGSTFCNIFNTDFTASYMGTGFQYQFKFVTDNGTTQFTSAWSNSPVFSSSQAPYVNYFRYNKIYEVYVRAKKCNANPSWCGPCVVTSCSQPYSFVNANCCRWRNKSSGGNITAQATVGNSNQYRFRFAPISINPCLAYPFTPIGIPVTTGWTSNAFVNPGSLPLTLGMVYNVQVQTRVLSATITNPNGTTTVVPGQTTDWGPNCMIGIRGSGSPAVGTALGCYCTPGMISEDDIFVYEEYRDLTFDSELNVPSIVTSIHENNIILDPSDAGLVGNGVLNIVNLSGQLVHSENMYSMENGNYIEIPIVEQLPSGIYLINIQSDSGSLTDKIYIQHE